MSYVIASMFFLRFWFLTRDSLFLAFAVAFVLLSVNQILVAVYGVESDTQVRVYLLRLVGFLVIIFGIVRKNISAR
jgi:hypothetical protein